MVILAVNEMPSFLEENCGCSCSSFLLFFTVLGVFVSFFFFCLFLFCFYISCFCFFSMGFFLLLFFLVSYCFVSMCL